MNDPEEDKYKPNPDYVPLENPAGCMGVFENGELIGWMYFPVLDPDAYKSINIGPPPKENNDHQS